jgi:hypothetical protein
LLQFQFYRPPLLPKLLVSSALPPMARKTSLATAASLPVR